jgi:tRNA modification GTPase
LADDRAIVTPLPGTTRDSFEEVVVINNLHYRLTDTAGIRKNGDLAEKMGVQRALRLLKEADLCLMVLDASRELDDEDRMVMEATAGRPTLTVINKIDLPLKWDPGQPHTAGLPGKPIKVSAKKEWGFEELKKAMTKNAEKDPTEGAVITRMRHKVALSKAAECLDRTLKAIEERMSPEFPAADIYEARSNVDSIRGVGCSTDILDRVFEQFCIGK